MTTGATERAENATPERNSEGGPSATGAPSGRPRPAAGTRPRGGGGGRRGGGRRPWGRRKVCQFCVDHVEAIDYKSVSRLRRYVSDRARIESGKKTGTCARHQRMLTQAIKRARFMALVPFTGEHARVTGPIAAPVQPRPEAPREEAAQEESAQEETPQPEGESASAEEERPAAEAATQPEADASNESDNADQNVESAEAEARE